MLTRSGSFEARAFRHHWDDGLLDVVAGLGALGIGLLWLADLVAVGAAVPAVLAALWAPLHRSLVEPRAGFVEFSDRRVQRQTRHQQLGLLLGACVLAVVLLVVTWIMPAMRADGQSAWVALAPAFPATILSVMAALTGWSLGLPRFLGYAGVLLLAGIVGARLGGEPGVAMVAGGGVILLAGGVRLGRFLRQPVPSGGLD